MGHPARPLRRTRANLGALTLFGSYIAFQFLLTQYLQSLAGWSAMSTALAFLPAGVVVAIVLAIVTAVVDAGGASQVTTAQATLGAYRPALALITGVAVLGAVVALTGTRPARWSRWPSGRLSPRFGLAGRRTRARR